ncbi:hypothetical protein EMPG_11774 [Blastomyces silverae]|uniref:Uncharacterized protein n=1 Tax=Blastomyces silverae TaxID=2060906 RepID=A0A0H1BQ83_9EURO|nr:hypothetical protein EMPG_11774 [Blastomyces silverae]
MHQPPHARDGTVQLRTSTSSSLHALGKLLRPEQATNQITQLGSARHLLRAREVSERSERREVELVPYHTSDDVTMGLSFSFRRGCGCGHGGDPVTCILLMFEDTPFLSKTAGKPYGRMVQGGSSISKPSFAYDKPLGNRADSINQNRGGEGQGTRKAVSSP